MKRGNARMQSHHRRKAGILLPVSSLPSPYGIGTLGEAAYSFLDWLEKAGASCWQVLPLGPTGYGNSPYQSYSAFAGNPYLIDLDLLKEQGLLTRRQLDTAVVPAENPVDYSHVRRTRTVLLRHAFEQWDSHNERFVEFCERQNDWLEDYALFMALKEHFGGRSWREWDHAVRMREQEALAACRDTFREEMAFHKACQFWFFEQWKELRRRAEEKGIELIGDIPIYVAEDSADVWAGRHLFQLDAQGAPRRVAGVPPDDFSADGQRWGNPLYDWGAMEQDGFYWWKRRIAACAQLYDRLRIDHFIGLVQYYAIPAACPTAVEGTWLPGPGKKLTDAIDLARGKTGIIAEDLGVVSPSVRELMRQTGYPGMKVLLFAFGGGAGNPHLPHAHTAGSVVYVGTHDNDTAAGYARQVNPEEWSYMREYLGIRHKKDLPWALIRAAYGSVADTAMVQMQDVLELDNRARMNRPSTVGDFNWSWRMPADACTDDLAGRLRHLAAIYDRGGKKYDANFSGTD